MQAAQQSPATLTLLATLERSKGEYTVSQREALKPSVSHLFLTRLQPRKLPQSNALSGNLDPTPLLGSRAASSAATVQSVDTVDPAAASAPAAPVMEVMADRSSASPIRDPASAVPATADQAFLATKFLSVVASTVASSALVVLVTLTVVIATPSVPAHGEKIVGKTTFQQLEVENSCQV